MRSPTRPILRDRRNRFDEAPGLPPEGGGAGSECTGVPEPHGDPGAGSLGVAESSLRGGCYLANFTPLSGDVVTYDGTFRLERKGRDWMWSGDFYQRGIGQLNNDEGTPALPPPPSPLNGIPVLPIGQYRYFVKGIDVRFSAAGITLVFEMWRHIPISRWALEGQFSAIMVGKTPTGYPEGADLFEGDVLDDNGVDVGRLRIGWVSDWLRKANIEIGSVAESEAALDNGAGLDWRAAFEAMSWDVTIRQGDGNVVEPGGESWSDAELHAAMLERRANADLDKEWRFHILCVRRLDSTSRGIMYDARGTDSNNVPREGVAVSSHWTIPDEDRWGLVRGQRVGTARAPYFRTAVHEIGHAMGLFHNRVNNGYMATTDRIARNSTPEAPFPTNVDWAFATDDQNRLKHYPDLFIRPGGAPFGDASEGEMSFGYYDQVLEAPGLVLKLAPLLETVPIGAPVRVTMDLTNEGATTVNAPASLHMKSGTVTGHVVDPAGVSREFRPLILCVDEDATAPLKAGGVLSHAVTLLRGADGPLFPLPGLHRVMIDVRWDMGLLEGRLSGETSVMVTPPTDRSHAEVAKRLLSTPDTLLSLVFGGDHLECGNSAIGQAVEDATLEPHFAYVEARRIGRRFCDRAPDLEKAARLLRVETVISPAEILRVVEFVQESAPADEENENAIAIANVLREKVRLMPVPEHVAVAVRRLQV